MKEITFLVPDDSRELITELVQRLGGSIDKKDEIKSTGINKKKPQNKVVTPSKKAKKEKIDHTYLFGKWKDFDIDAKKLREESW